MLNYPLVSKDVQVRGIGHPKCVVLQGKGLGKILCQIVGVGLMGQMASLALQGFYEEEGEI